jgi:hypothetical protein
VLVEVERNGRAGVACAIATPAVGRAPRPTAPYIVRTVFFYVLCGTLNDPVGLQAHAVVPVNLGVEGRFISYARPRVRPGIPPAGRTASVDVRPARL